ncbi:MAG: NFACT RNA binding domain-containing protein [archaeon]
MAVSPLSCNMISLDYSKSLEENASLYYEKAKKAKKKLEGARGALVKSRQRLEKLESLGFQEVKNTSLKSRKTEWYERFRWFQTSEGILCIGGRDATTNEIIIKKHLDPPDIVFHTDMAGSPFFVLKVADIKPSPASLSEAAAATASYSRAWRAGLSHLEVLHVKPEQVSKEARSGEFLPKGAFMIYGKTAYIPSKIELAIGLEKDRVIAGPVSAVSAHVKRYVEIIPGHEKAGQVAKKIRQKLGGGELDDIIRMLPGGNSEIKK